MMLCVLIIGLILGSIVGLAAHRSANRQDTRCYEATGYVEPIDSLRESSTMGNPKNFACYCDGGRGQCAECEWVEAEFRPHRFNK